MTHRFLPLVLALAASSLVAACGDGTLGGSMTVNGQKANVDSCTFGTGPAGAFREVRGQNGARLRISETKAADGKASVTLIQFAAAGGQLVDVKCGSSATSHSSVFGKVSGKANLGNCTGANTTASAELTYAKCTAAP